jgi:hypothetical protein
MGGPKKLPRFKIRVAWQRFEAMFFSDLIRT